MTNLIDFAKLRIALYHKMQAKEMFRACAAFHKAENLHNGTRKDGVTPEFSHQIWIATFITNMELPDSTMETMLISVFYHDAMEDKDLSREEVSRLYGEDVADITWRMTKTWRGTKLSNEEYYNRLIGRPESIMAKAVDRIHNLKTMAGVFKPEKMIEYATEAKEFHLPMLKDGRRDFPQYSKQMHLLGSILIIQIDTILSLL